MLLRNGELDYRDAHGWGGSPPRCTSICYISPRMLLPDGDSFLPFQVTGSMANGVARDFSVTGDIRLTRRDLRCDVRCADVGLSFLQRVMPVKLPLTLESGHVDGCWQVALTQVHDTGTPACQITLAADFRDARGVLQLKQPMPYHFQYGHLCLANHTLQMMQLQGEVGGVPVALNGEITYFPTPVFALQLQTSGADTAMIVSRIPALARLPYHWSGTTTGCAQITGQLGTLHVIGHVQGPDVSTKYGEYTDLGGDFAYDNGALAMTNLSGQGFGGKFNGNAWIVSQSPRPPAVYLEGQAAGVDIHQVLAQFTASTAVSSVSTAVRETLRTVGGTVSGPLSLYATSDGQLTMVAHSHGAVSAADVSQGEVDADWQLDITRDEMNARISRAEVQLPEGDFQLKGTVSTRDGLQMKARGDKLGLHLLAAGLHRDDLFGTGYLSGDLSGPLAQPCFTGSLDARDGSLAGHAFTQVTGEVQATLGASPGYSCVNSRCWPAKLDCN